VNFNLYPEYTEYDFYESYWDDNQEIKDAYEDEHIRMVIYEETSDSGQVTDVMKWFTKVDDGSSVTATLQAEFPDSARTEESALWFDGRNGFEFVNTFIEDNGESRKYYTVLAIYDRDDKTRHNLLSIELFVFPNGEISFANKWARLAPNSNTRDYLSIAANKALTVVGRRR
jgi:hypothetical protein